MVWPELTYAHEAALPDGTKRASPDAVAFDRALFAHYQRMIALRRSLPALSDGSMRVLIADDSTGVLVFVRETPEQRVIVALAASDQAQTVRVPVPRASQFRDALGDGQGSTRGDQREDALVLEVPARWGAVWVGPG